MSEPVQREAWDAAYRSRNLEQLGRTSWDVVIVGGGIMGAALLLECARRGVRVLLLEQNDFASGSSSRTGKLVHGGMRYIKQGRFDLTAALLRERDRLVREAPGLVVPIEFMLPLYHDRLKDSVAHYTGGFLYDALRARMPRLRRFSAQTVSELVPGVASPTLAGGVPHGEAATDDARLVLRLLRDGCASGGCALNYVRVDALMRAHGAIRGVTVTDAVSGQSWDVAARLVINATGAWADRLRGNLGRPARMRPLRGSHLVVSYARLPVRSGIALRHPVDGRYLYVLPWEGATVIGCTDLDHEAALEHEPHATEEEIAYLIDGLNVSLPAAPLARSDVISTFAGVRPVVGTGRAPSAEKRDSVVWEEDGLLTVTGGKLTAFRPTAEAVLRRAHIQSRNGRRPTFERGHARHPDPAVQDRLNGRYGADATAMAGDEGAVEGLPTQWSEVRWAARAEGVQHLDDLLLRRTRLGLLLPDGAQAVFARIRQICQQELGWDAARWESEAARYRLLHQRNYRGLR